MLCRHILGKASALSLPPGPSLVLKFRNFQILNLEFVFMTDGNHHLHPRTVKDSQSEMAEVVLPNDANPLGNLLGGRLMHLIDIAGALACHRHSRSYVVTASTDHLDFLAPVHVGDLLILRSSVNRAFNTSMEVGV